MHACLVIGEVIMAFQLFFNIISIQNSHLACLFKAISPHCPYITVCPQHNCKVAVKCFKPPDALWSVIIKAESFAFFYYPWFRQERLKGFFHAYGPAPRAAPALWRCKRLFPLELDYI